MFRYLPVAAAVAALLLLPAPGPAAKVKAWHHHAPAHYEKARLQGAVVSSEGVVRLSRRLRPLAGLDATHAWDVVEDAAGNLIVATGDEGKLFKVAPDGTASVLFASGDSQVLCLARAPDGSVYAGTGPGGQVIRVDPRGACMVIHRWPGTYVWSLAVGAKGEGIYAGTGPKGTVYRLTPDGKASVHYATRQEHVLSVAVGPDGTVYAGTDKAGLVYRLDGPGKGFVLFGAPQAEVRRLLVTPEAVYAGTSAPTGGRRPGPGERSAGGGLSSSFGGRGASSLSAAGPDKVRAAAGGGVESSSADPRASKGSPAAAPAAPAGGENSVWRIGFDGSVRELFRERALVLSLLRLDGRLLVGTGMDGRLFEVDEATKERGEIARLDHGQVLALARRKGGDLVLAAGDPAKLYVLQDRHVERGTVLSEVLDARLISRWGAVRWQADTPPGTRVGVAVRSGNVAEPDDTWGPWSAEQTNPEEAVAAAPPARYLQYRVTLTTDRPEATPALRGLTVRYLNGNQAPEVTALEVPDLETTALENPKRLRITWTASDPNEDELTYQLYVRKDGWDGWVPLEDEVEKKEYEWDTTGMPSGVYRLKVVASDRRDNPAGAALTHARVSEPFVVAHGPAEVTLRAAGLDGGRMVLEAKAAHPLARLAAASFAVNGKGWTNVFPVDGIFDGKAETFRFTTGPLQPGSYVVVLRVRDAAGNVGSGDVVFTVPAAPAAKR